MTSNDCLATRTLCVCVAIVAAVWAGPALADYSYTTIDFPGATVGGTQIDGVNIEGQLVGSASIDGISGFGFVYNPRTKVFSVLPNVPGAGTTAHGINAFGVVVGGATDSTTFIESGTILDKGAFTLFSHPGSSQTEARGINAFGFVSGYATDDATGNSFGFIYDPTHKTFVDFLPSPLFTLAQGINIAGQVVGSVFLLADGAYPGSPQGDYGFVRRASGAVTLFRVNGGATSARGITDAGRIAGFFVDAVTHRTRGFVTELPSHGAYQSLILSAGKLLDVPGATGTLPESINEFGVIVGDWIDAAGGFHGFRAAAK